MPTTPTPDTLICVGAIMGAFGVKGEVRLKSFCAVPGDIDTYGPLYSEDGKTTYDLSLTANVKGGFSGRIKSIRYRDQAEALRGTKLYVPREALGKALHVGTRDCAHAAAEHAGPAPPRGRPPG